MQKYDERLEITSLLAMSTSTILLLIRFIMHLHREPLWDH